MTRYLATAVLVACASSAAWADELRVSAPSTLVGDGRTPASIEVTGGPDRFEGERKNNPARPHLECTNGRTLPAVGGRPPAVIPSATRAATEMSCTAHLRGASKGFKVAVAPPPAGLYAVIPSTVRADGGKVELEVFVMDANRRARPARGLRVATSSGSARVRGSRVVLTLPKGNAPRTIALLLREQASLGAAFIAVAGVTKVPVKTRRGATLTLRIAGREFGPWPAPTGKVEAPIVVPAGVGQATARAVSKSGFVNEKPIDLRIPSFPSAVVLPESAVVVGTTTKLRLAVATPRGEPGRQLDARVDQGKLGPSRQLGQGLWEIDYRAPDNPTTANLEIDSGGQVARIELAVRAGKVAKIELQSPPGALVAGAAFETRMQLSDSLGNPVTNVEPVVRIGDRRYRATADGSGFAIVGQLPQRLDRELSLEVEADGRRQTRPLAIEPAPVATIELKVTPFERDARVRIVSRDRFGNPTDPRLLKLELDGASLSLRSNRDGEARAVIVADRQARTALLRVRASSALAVERRVEFGPPASALLLGARAHGSLSSNLGELVSPRAGVEAGLRRGLGPVELALFIGLQAARASNDAEGVSYTVS
ncbi:MAG: hypothetical protein KJO07_12890, partial [Deltaproteobacteria bacterium]|nr:hypothetical protein [Deltaproteobacteria bacterium]